MNTFVARLRTVGAVAPDSRLRLVGVAVSVFAIVTGIFLTPAGLPLIADGVQHGDGLTGQLATVYFLVLGMTAPLSRLVTKDKPKRTVLLIGMVLWVVATVMATMTTSLLGLVLLWFLSAVAAGAILAPLQQAAAECTRENVSSHKAGVLQGSAVAAVTVGVPVAAFLGETTGHWYQMFTCAGVFGVVAVVAVGLTFSGGSLVHPGGTLRTQISHLQAPGLGSVMGGAFFGITGGALMIVYLTSFLDWLAGSDLHGSLAFAVFGIAAIVGVVLGSVQVKKTGSDATLTLCLFVFAALMILATLLWVVRPIHPVVALVVTLCAGVVAGMAVTAFRIKLHILAGDRDGLAIGALATAAPFGAAGGAAAGGWLVSVGMIGLLPLVTAVIVLVGLVLVRTGVIVNAKKATLQRHNSTTIRAQGIPILRGLFGRRAKTRGPRVRRRLPRRPGVEGDLIIPDFVQEKKH